MSRDQDYILTVYNDGQVPHSQSLVRAMEALAQKEQDPDDCAVTRHQDLKNLRLLYEAMAEAERNNNTVGRALTTVSPS